MNFAFTDEQAMIAEAARSLFADHATAERTLRVVDSGVGQDTALWHAATTELGVGGMLLPESHGGSGLGFVELAILSEAAGYHVAALPLLATVGLAAPALLAGGSEAQTREWLPRIAEGAIQASAILPETAGELSLRDGRICGTASYVPHGARADLFVVAMPGGEVALVPGDAPGLSVVEHVSLDMTRPHATLSFDDVAAEFLPDASAALAAMRRSGWICIAADALGGAQACLDKTAAYARERVQFGRPIGSFQAVKHQLADMMVDIEQARSAVYWAACAADEGTDDAMLAAHSAKAFATDAYASCAGKMIQLHGGIGFTWEHEAHLYFKRARSDQSLLGSPSWHRERIAQIIGLDEAA